MPTTPEEPRTFIVIERSGERHVIEIAGDVTVTRENPRFNPHHPDGSWRAEAHGAILRHAVFDTHGTALVPDHAQIATA